MTDNFDYCARIFNHGLAHFGRESQKLKETPDYSCVVCYPIKEEISKEFTQ